MVVEIIISLLLGMSLLSIKSIKSSLIPRILEAPETGMGYSRISTNNLSLPFIYSNLENTSRIIVNSEYIFSIKDLNNLPLFFNQEVFINSQLQEYSFEELKLVLNPKYDSAIGSTVLPSYTYYSKPGDVFIRLSAFKNDRRILADGSVLPGTYATTLNDMKVIPSGAAAVGRYALPYRLPACNIYRIIPLPNTPVFFGTVTPNYGLCGGGVEVYFPNGCHAKTAYLYETISDK